MPLLWQDDFDPCQLLLVLRRELVARPEHPMEEEKPGRVTWLTVVLVVVVLVGVALLVFAR